jgi:hypothetical protein
MRYLLLLRNVEATRTNYLIRDLGLTKVNGWPDFVSMIDWYQALLFTYRKSLGYLSTKRKKGIETSKVKGVIQEFCLFI